jgi:hypothetical protein
MKMKLKKVIIPLLGLSALSAAALGVGATIHAQDKTSESAVAQANKKTLSQVLANEYKATTKFSLGEDFNYDGLVVTAVYSNSTQKVLEKGMYTVDARNFNKNKQGTYTIFVVYVEGTFRATTKYNVTVSSIAENTEPHLLGIEATLPKTVYKLGEKIDTTGLEVRAYYSDDTSKVLENGKYTVDESLLNMDSMGTSMLKFKYQESYSKDGKTEDKKVETFLFIEVQGVLGGIKFVSGTLTVKQDTLGPDNTYTTMDVSDWKVEATFTDAKYRRHVVEIDPNDLTLSGLNTGASGKQEVTISYYAFGITKSTKVEVMVEAIAAPDYTFNASDIDAALVGSTIAQETKFDDIISFGNKCQVKTEVTESSSGKTFGDLTFTNRVQTNGAGKAGTQNYIKVTLTKDATVAIIGRSSGDAKPVKAAGFYNENNVAVSDTKEYITAISKYKYDLKAGTYYFYDPSYAVQVYGIQIWYK